MVQTLLERQRVHGLTPQVLRTAMLAAAVLRTAVLPTKEFPVRVAVELGLRNASGVPPWRADLARRRPLREFARWLSPLWADDARKGFAPFEPRWKYNKRRWDPSAC